MKKVNFVKKLIYQYILSILLSAFIVLPSHGVILSLYFSPSVKFNQVVVNQMKQGCSFRPRNIPIICTDKPTFEIVCYYEKPFEKKEFLKAESLTTVLKESYTTYDKIFF